MRNLIPTKKTLLLNFIAFVVFLLPLLIYATAQSLKLDFITIVAPFIYGIFYEKAKRFIKSKFDFFGE